MPRKVVPSSSSKRPATASSEADAAKPLGRLQAARGVSFVVPAPPIAKTVDELCAEDDYYRQYRAQLLRDDPELQAIEQRLNDDPQVRAWIVAMETGLEQSANRELLHLADLLVWSGRSVPEVLLQSNPHLARRIQQWQGNWQLAEHITKKTQRAGTQITRPVKRSRPGYVAPTRDNKKALLTYVSESDHSDFKAIAKLNGTSTEALLRDAVAAIVEQYKKPGQVNEAVAETVERYRNTLRKTALRLVPGAK
jgi:hypothetical protein